MRTESELTTKNATERNRNARKYENREQLLRILWHTGSYLFYSTPHNAYLLRSAILRMFGAKIGENVRIANTARIQFPWLLSVDRFSAIGDCARIYNLAAIIIGQHVTISQYSHLCAGTHDYRSLEMPLIKLPITIEDNVWVCSDAFVGPGVTIRYGAIVGARAVVTNDVERLSIVVGNPAVHKKSRILL